MTSRLPTEVRLVLIADVGYAGAERVVDLVDAALPVDCGRRVMIVERDKRPTAQQNDRLRLHRLRDLRRLSRERNALCVVNQRLDLALASHADGVHLPENGLATPDVRRMYPKMWIGRSCHDEEGLARAQASGADWVFLSPIAQPNSKTSTESPLGLTRFAEMVRLFTIPIFGLGGITPSHVSPVMNCGAQGIAVTGYVLGATNPHRALSKLLGDY